jgi:hypothetical protein
MVMLRGRVLIVVLAVGLLAPQAAVSSSLGWGLAASALADDPQMMAGVVVGGDERPIPGATVEASAEERRGRDVMIEHRFAVTTTDAAGAFVLTGRLPANAARNPDGSTSIMVRVSTAQVERYFLVNAVPPARPGADWSWGEQVDVQLLAATRFGAAQQLAGEPLAGIVLDLSAATPNLTPVTAGDPLAQRGGRITVEECYNAGVYYLIWVFSGRKRDRMMPIQKIDTQTHARARLAWQNSHNTSLGAVFQTPAHPAYSLGLSYSQKQTRSAGLTWTAKNRFHGLYRLNWRYRKYVQYCTTSSQVDTKKEAEASGAAVRTGKGQWRPFQWLGGNAPYSVFESFYCHEGTGVQTSYAKTWWVMRSTTHRLDSHASLLGVGLVAQQVNSKLHKVVYLLDADSKYLRLCGNDAAPPKATKVREVDY